ncbi:hypothetical protein ACVWWO_003454 [Bradyrhizobium sp. F1.13.1]
MAGHRPAVVSVNMFASALAVNEMLARLHPYREEPNGAYAAVRFSFASMELIYDPEEGICDNLGPKVGFGDTTPFLGLIELAEKAKDVNRFRRFLLKQIGSCGAHTGVSTIGSSRRI